ncbi:MAG: hypothetical protein ACLFV8_13940 [Alphaproteobacteria bacterium]
MSATHKCTGCGAPGAFWRPEEGRQAAVRGPVIARCERCGGEREWISGAGTGAPGPADKGGPHGRLTTREAG